VRQQWLHPLADTRPTAAKGIGVFALDAIPAGTTVAGFGGRVVDGKELESLGQAVRIHALQIDDDLFLASTPPFDPADYVNHSCDPNCGIVGSVLLVTLRDVQADEELCFDYAMTDSDDYDMFTCSCGTPGWYSTYLERRLR
jgi:SET domain-containing protein